MTDVKPFTITTLNFKLQQEHRHTDQVAEGVIISILPSGLMTYSESVHGSDVGNWCSVVFIYVLFPSVFRDLTLWCRCDISDPEVWTGYWRWTHILPQSWDFGQGEHYFIPVLRL